MDAIIINRVSSTIQTDGYSLDAQEKHGREYAEHKGYNILKIYSFQETASKQTQRKIFHGILSFIEDYNPKKTLVVIAEKSDRLGRNHTDNEVLQSLYKEGRIEVHLYRENKVFDKNSNATDIFIDDIMTSVSKYGALNIARESQKGLREKASQGWMPRKAPIGYKNSTIKHPDGRKEKIIVIDPELSCIISRIFELRAARYSYSNIIHTILKVEKIVPSAHINKFRGKSKIESIIKNPFYGVSRGTPKPTFRGQVKTDNF